MMILISILVGALCNNKQLIQQTYETSQLSDESHNPHPSTAVPLLPRQGIIRKLFVAHQGTTVNALEWEKPSRTKTPPLAVPSKVFTNRHIKKVKSVERGKTHT